MRYLFGFLCVCALGVLPLAGCSEAEETGGSGGSGGSGGVGGVFAPALFVGGMSGATLGAALKMFTSTTISENNFALVGMAGVMAGVMHAFVKYIAPKTDAHLALVGPSTVSVTDDPEGQIVLDEITEEWRSLPDGVRDRVHLISVPMDDPEENGALVNAIQRHAAVVTQKSLAEGFGLTVTEAMFKGRPVIASSVGGIVDQIDDQVSGVLISDPRDLKAFGKAVRHVLNDPEWAERLGIAARQRAIDVFLPDTSLDLWNDAVLSALNEVRNGTS